MKRFALTSMLAGSILAGLIGSAATADADAHVGTSVHTRSVIVRH